MAGSKRVIVFSTRPAPVILKLLEKLRERNHQVVLVICSPGTNYALAPTAIHSMGALVSTIVDEAESPPPVLCVTKVSQLEPIYFALDPDLALVYGYPYKITEKLLSHRSKFVNYHPAPLPMMRGPRPFPWMVMDGNIPMTATWHYMVKGFDEGPVIYELEMPVPPGKTRDTVTATDISHAGNDCFFQSLYIVLDLVEDGYEGKAQDMSSSGDLWAGRIMTDDERTVKADMSIEEVMKLARAFDGPGLKPLLKFNGDLYYALRLARLEGEEPTSVGTQKRVGMDLIQHFHGGAVKMAIRKV